MFPIQPEIVKVSQSAVITLTRSISVLKYDIALGFPFPLVSQQNAPGINCHGSCIAPEGKRCLRRCQKMMFFGQRDRQGGGTFIGILGGTLAPGLPFCNCIMFQAAGTPPWQLKCLRRCSGAKLEVQRQEMSVQMGQNIHWVVDVYKNHHQNK